MGVLIIMPTVVVISLSSPVNRDHLIQWEPLWQRTIPISAIFQPHSLGGLPAQVQNSAEQAPNPQGKPGDHPKPAQARTRTDHEGIVQPDGELAG
jgi:hypothetical protein